jgi:hypothetical protein
MLKKLPILEILGAIAVGMFLHSYHSDMNGDETAKLPSTAPPAAPQEKAIKTEEPKQEDTSTVLLRDGKKVDVILTEQDRQLIALDLNKFEHLTIDETIMIVTISKEYLTYNEALTDQPVTMDDRKTLVSFLKSKSNAFKENQLVHYKMGKDNEYSYLNMYLNLINNDALIELYRNNAETHKSEASDLKSVFENRFAGYLSAADNNDILFHVDVLCSAGYNKDLGFMCNESGKQFYHEVIGYNLANIKKWRTKITGSSVESLDSYYDSEEHIEHYLSTLLSN